MKDDTLTFTYVGDLCLPFDYIENEYIFPFECISFSIRISLLKLWFLFYNDIVVKNLKLLKFLLINKKLNFDKILLYLAILFF